MNIYLLFFVSFLKSKKFEIIHFPFFQRASNSCNFCDKVGSQQIRNNRNSFNYSCLEVKKKDERKENQGKKKKEDKVLT
jgi:hypothetical protein